jgi:hypothetical protein
MGKERNGEILKKGLLFVLIIALIDVVSGFVFDSLYRSSKSGVAYQENYVFNKTNDSILIFGSSRAAFHYIPDIITNKTGLSCYNAGREGMGIYFHYAALLATLDRYSPKIVVLDLDFRDVFNRGGNFGEDVFSDLAPFYGKISNEFDDYISRNWYDAIFYHSNLIKYNKKIFNIITANVQNNRDNFKGYRPLFGEWDGREKVLKEDTFAVDTTLINTINLFIAKAKSKNSKVVLVISPTFKEIKPDFFIIAKEIAIKNKVELFDYHKTSEFVNNKKLFYDSEHLNDEGAKLFSKEFANQINK